MTENAGGEPQAGSGRLWDKVMEAIRRGVIGFFRQSSDKQRKKNVGSQKVQQEQIANVAPFGVAPEQVRVILAYGESGRADVVRRKFRQLYRVCAARQAGLVLLARHDRLGRNFADAEALFEVMRQNGVLIMVDGRVYDPADESDDFILTIHAKFAEFENRARSRWLSLARFAKARDRSLAVGLPSGLVWADPNDPNYRDPLIANGMGGWLEDLDRHQTRVEVEGERRLILPFPDPRVEQCIRLLVQWILETGSVAEVAHRVEQGYGGWPEPGMLPVRKGDRHYGPGCSIGWSRVTPPKVYDYLRSPALYGTYQFHAPALNPNRPRKLRRSFPGEVG